LRSTTTHLAPRPRWPSRSSRVAPSWRSTALPLAITCTSVNVPVCWAWRARRC